jgi:hypothetical protein
MEVKLLQLLNASFPILVTPALPQNMRTEKGKEEKFKGGRKD